MLNTTMGINNTFIYSYLRFIVNFNFQCPYSSHSSRHLYRKAGTYSVKYRLFAFCIDLESWNSISRKANFDIIHRTQIDTFPVI